VEIDDVQPAGLFFRFWRRRLAFRRLAFHRLARRGFALFEIVGQGEFFADFLFPGGEKFVAFFKGRKPVFLAAEEDVTDGQPAGGRVLPGGVGPETDAAALQRQKRLLQGGQGAAEVFHFAPPQRPAVAR
jgi:hypothetical protein